MINEMRQLEGFATKCPCLILYHVPESSNVPCDGCYLSMFCNYDYPHLASTIYRFQIYAFLTFPEIIFELHYLHILWDSIRPNVSSQDVNKIFIRNIYVDVVFSIYWKYSAQFLCHGHPKWPDNLATRCQRAISGQEISSRNWANVVINSMGGITFNMCFQFLKGICYCGNNSQNWTGYSNAGICDIAIQNQTRRE